jgi:hypothetical protein
VSTGTIIPIEDNPQSQNDLGVRKRAFEEITGHVLERDL